MEMMNWKLDRPSLRDIHNKGRHPSTTFRTAMKKKSVATLTRILEFIWEKLERRRKYFLFGASC
jgi:hypothetical protein